MTNQQNRQWIIYFRHSDGTMNDGKQIFPNFTKKHTSQEEARQEAQRILDELKARGDTRDWQATIQPRPSHMGESIHTSDLIFLQNTLGLEHLKADPELTHYVIKTALQTNSNMPIPFNELDSKYCETEFINACKELLSKDLIWFYKVGDTHFRIGIHNHCKTHNFLLENFKNDT